MIIHRPKELLPLQQALRSVQSQNRLQVRFICGEAGSGKTILANLFSEDATASETQTLVVAGHCSIRADYGIAYQPFKELLRQLLCDLDHDAQEQRKSRSNKEIFKDALAFSAKMLVEHAPDLLENFVPGAAVLGALGKGLLGKDDSAKDSGTLEESKITEQYVEAIRAIATRYRLVLILDDLQWIDNASVFLFHQLLTHLQNCPVMILGLYRSTDIDVTHAGEKHPMSALITEVKIGHGNVFVNLDSQSESDRKDLMNRMLDSEANLYDQTFRDKLFERTNGNPLFVAELVNLLKEEEMLVQNSEGTWRNNANLQWRSYPMRIEGIIQERIGRLEDSMVEVLSHASVQGYNFIAQVLSRTLGDSERNLLMTLSKKLQKEHHLVCEGSCVRSNRGIVSRFNFSNYIFQQYLYHELSLTQRMMLHSDIAGILEELFKDNLDDVAGDIARHYEMSGEYSKALEYIQRSIAATMRLSAFQDALVVLNKAQELLAQTNDCQSKEQTRLDLEVHQCICNRYLKGWGHPDMLALYTSAKSLSDKLNADRHLDTILFGLWTIHLTRLELDQCLSMAYENLQLAKQRNNIDMEQTALVSVANTLFWMGRFPEAANALEAFWQLDKPGVEPSVEKELTHGFAMMFDYLITCKSHEADKIALHKSKLQAWMKNTQDRVCESVALQALAWQACMSDNLVDMELYVPAYLKITESLQLTFYRGLAYMFHGALLAKTHYEEGLHSLHKGYALLQEHSHCEIVVTHSVYALLTHRAHLQANRHDQNAETLETQIARAQKHNELAYLSELQQIQSQRNHNV